MTIHESEGYEADDRLVAAGEAALKHYGVPGMKWGHRKGPDSSGSRASQRLSDAAKATGRAAQTTGQAAAKAGRASAPHIKRAAKASVPAAKIAAKVGLRVGVVAALSAIGVPAAVATGSLAMLVAANPEMIQMGADHVKVLLDDAGIRNMGIKDELITRARVSTYPPVFETTTTVNGVVQK
jgi:hypothetical protein